MMYGDHSAMTFIRGGERGRGPQESAGRGRGEAVKEKGIQEKHEARVGEVQQELQDAVKKCQSLERQNADQESELSKAHQSAQEA